MKPIFILFLAFLAFGCSDQKVKNHLSELQLQGDVREIKEVMYSATRVDGEIQKNEVLHDRKCFVFNRSGNLLFKSGYSFDPRSWLPWGQVIYKYDEKGRMVESSELVSKPGENPMIEYEQYGYDEETSLITSKLYKLGGEFADRRKSDIEFTYTHDKKGYLISEESKSNMSHTVTSYINDKKGNCIESTSSQGNKTTYKYDKHSNCIEKITEKDGVVQNKVVQNFDEKGNMIESITYNSDNEILRHRKESYDTYGNRLYYEDITVEYSEQCTYEYDEKFNWVKSIVTCTQSGEKKIFLLEREIEYYSNSFDAGEANSNPIMQGIADNMVLVQVPDGEKQTGLISNSFYINRFEVTQREWLEIMGSNPSGFRGHMDRPVEQLKLDETLEFIKKLNEATGKNYRLPTLDEWIFAAQGGAYSNKYPYPGAKKLDYVAWYSSLWRGQGNSAAQTHVVGLRVPNELGIYDMFGNVAETVQASNNTYFIIGGSWYNSENAFTYKKKASWYPGVRSDDILGFRLCHDVKM